jgi:hypothetical protein
MDQVERIVTVIRQELPRAEVRVERSENPRGPVWIDVAEGDQGVALEWRQGMSLGLTSLPSDGYGEAADELYESIEDAVRRVRVLFETRTRTASPSEALLSELRARRRISQEDLARLLRVSQPNVSKLERRTDMSVQTLRALIEAIGGRLEIIARFGDEAIRVSQFDDAALSRK